MIQRREGRFTARGVEHDGLCTLYYDVLWPSPPAALQVVPTRQRLRESTLKENPVWSPVGRLAVMAGSWQLLQLTKYSDYSTLCFSWLPSEAESRVMMLGQLMAL